MISQFSKIITFLLVIILFSGMTFAQYNELPKKSNEQKIKGLIEILKNYNNKSNDEKTDDDEDEAVAVINGLYNFGKDAKEAIPYLIEFLKKDKSDRVRVSASNTLGKIGTESVPYLIEILKENKDKETLFFALASLKKMKEEAKDAVPTLREILKNNKDSDVVNSAIITLNEIGKDAKDAIPELREVLKSKRGKESLINTLYALGSIGKESKTAVPELLEIFNSNKDEDIQEAVVIAFGKIGGEAKDAIPLLFNKYSIYEKEKSYKPDYSFDAITQILDDLNTNNDFSANTIISESFEKNKDKFSVENQQQIKNKIKALLDGEKSQNIDRTKKINDFINDYLFVLVPLAITVLLFVLWLIIFSVKPSWLLAFHERFFSTDTNQSSVSLFKSLSFRIQPLIAVFCIRQTTIDAWLKDNLEKASASFGNRKTVKERNLYIPVRVSYNGENMDFTPQNFREIFSKNQLQLLIYGDGGSGKTSLACQIARWGLNGSLFEKHFALPIFVEENIENIQTEIKKKLKELVESKKGVSDHLQKKLLQEKRILLILDGISELDKKNIEQVKNNTDINAVVYTSRNDEVKDIEKIETNNISPENLYHFISEFIEKSIGLEKKENLFPSDELFIYCQKLSKLVGEKGISVLIAKYYAEQIIAQKERKASDNLPNNVPDLMIQSIKVLHKKDAYKAIDFFDVVKVLKMIAYECLRKDYRPIPANRSNVDEALEKIENGKTIFEHLKENLKVIEIKGIADDKIAFKIDTLAEYLAASYLVEENSYKTDKWKASLEDMQKKSAENNIKGFLVAVKDCCKISENVDESTVEKLDKILKKTDL